MEIIVYYLQKLDAIFPYASLILLAILIAFILIQVSHDILPMKILMTNELVKSMAQWYSGSDNRTEGVREYLKKIKENEQNEFQNQGQDLQNSDVVTNVELVNNRIKQQPLEAYLNNNIVISLLPEFLRIMAEDSSLKQTAINRFCKFKLDDKSIRLGAIRILGRTALNKKEDDEIRFSAVWALGELCKGEVASSKIAVSLVNTIKTTDNENLAIACARALQKIKNSTAAARLEKVIKKKSLSDIEREEIKKVLDALPKRIKQRR